MPTTPSKLEAATGRHKRSQSSVLKSIVSPRGRDYPPSTSQSPTKTPAHAPRLPNPSFISPPRYSPLGEVNSNRGRSPTRRPVDGKEKADTRLRTNRSRAQTGTTPEYTQGRSVTSPSKVKSKDLKESGSPTKGKSSTSLVALLSKSKTSKSPTKQEVGKSVDKENETPPPSSSFETPAPIWAEFSQRDHIETPRTTKVPLKNGHDLDDEMTTHVQHHSPSKTQGFYDSQSGTEEAIGKPRPRSWMMPSTSSKATDGSPTKRANRPTLRPKSQIQTSETNFLASRENSASSDMSMSSARPKPEGEENSKKSPGLTIAKRGSRVMAAVAAWNGKSKDSATDPKDEGKQDLTTPEQVDNAFEKMLVSPHMLSLKGRD